MTITTQISTPILGAINFATYKPAGDGITDDSDKFNLFIAAVAAGPKVGYIPPGTYFIPRAVTITVQQPISLSGEHQDRSVLLGTGLTQRPLFALARGGLTLTRLGFRRLGDVVRANASVVKADLAEVSLLDCTFAEVARPLIGHLGVKDSASFTLGQLRAKVIIRDSLAGLCWRGKIKAADVVVDARRLKVTDAHVQQIAEMRLKDGTYSNAGWAHAVKLGETESQPFACACQAVRVHDCFIEDIRDERTPGSTLKQECHGIVVGAHNYAVERNTVRKIYSRARHDSEGIYVKGRGRIIGNTLVNACAGGEGQIAAKGELPLELGSRTHGQGVEIRGNKITATDKRGGQGCPAIASYHWDAVIADNIIEGGGGKGLLGKAAVISTAHRISHRVSITGNTIRNAWSQFGIAVNSQGRDLRVERNTIDGLSGELDTTKPPTGIAVIPFGCPEPMVNTVIAGNTVSRLGRPGRAVLVTAAGLPWQPLQVTDNRCDGSCAEGLRVDGNASKMELRHANNTFGAAKPVVLPGGTSAPKIV